MECKRGDVVCHLKNFFKNMNFVTYCRRKSYSQISMDVALVVINALHLTRIVQGNPVESLRTVKIVLLAISITLEVLIAILIVVKERYNIHEEEHHGFLSLLNDSVVYLIFGSVVIHIFITVFVEDLHVMQARYSAYKNCTR